jgi:hypothetical protein
LSIFADGGVFTAIEKGLAPFLLLVLGLFIMVLAAVFWIVDARSQELLRLTIPALRVVESKFSDEFRLFALDAASQGKWRRYTTGIRILLISQMVFGGGVTVYGAVKLWC